MNLQFSIESAAAEKFGASPHIVFKLRAVNGGPETIQSILLKCQVQIEVARRPYTTVEKHALSDLFGETNRWAQSQRNLLWAHLSVVLPSFTGSLDTDLHVPCTFDFNAAASKYFAGLDEGDAPIGFYFNGAVFYENGDGILQTAPISWDQEASFRLPIRIWREMMDIYYPNSAWLCLERDAFEKLHAFKRQRGIPTFDEALTRAIAAAESGS
jgi:hypothetical protein